MVCRSWQQIPPPVVLHMFFFFLTMTVIFIFLVFPHPVGGSKDKDVVVSLCCLFVKPFEANAVVVLGFKYKIHSYSL